MKILFTFIAVGTFFIAGCDNTDFSSGAAAAKKDKKPVANTDDAKPETKDSESPVLEGGEGIVDCTLDPVLDEKATFDTASQYPDIRTFVNDKCTAKVVTGYADQGGINAGQKTRDALCQMMGYVKASPTAFTTWKFSSPHNNTVVWWDSSTKEFIQKMPATTAVEGVQGNVMIRSMTCIGKLKPECPSKAVDALKCK